MANEYNFGELVGEIRFDLPKSEQAKLETLQDSAPKMESTFNAFAKGGSAIFAAFAALSFLFGQGGFRQLVGALMDIANLFFVLVGPVLLPLFKLMRGAAERIKAMIDKFEQEGFWGILTDPETWKFVGDLLLAVLVAAAAGFIAAIAGASAPLIGAIAAVVGALAAVVYLGLDWVDKLVDGASWLWNKLKAGGAWLLNKMKQGGVWAWTWLKKGANWVWSKLKMAGKTVWNWITSAATSLWESVVNIGTSIASAFVNFLTGVDWSAVFAGAATGVGGALWSAATGGGGNGEGDDNWWDPFN